MLQQFRINIAGHVILVTKFTHHTWGILCVPSLALNQA
jgi:hypothetical protein